MGCGRAAHRRALAGNSVADVSNETVIICPELTPGAGGLADYTLRILEQWGETATVRIIVPEPSDASASLTRKVRLDVVERNAASLARALPANGGKVLLQYSAYGFDRFGYPRWLLRALIDWKEQSRGILVVMLHEIWTFWPVLNKNYVVQQLHRRDIRALIAKADATFTSTASQAEHLRQLAPGSSVTVLPVGSNIQPAGTPQTSRDRALAVLFGLEGSRTRTLEQLRSQLQALAANGRLRKIITAGAGSGEQEQTLLAQLRLPEGFEQRGPLAEEDVSELLFCASFGISAQDDVSLTKSGTFMAYAAHGLNVLSPHGAASKPEPLCWLTTPGELCDGVEASELARRAERLQEWQERTAAWPHIAEQFARALHLVDADDPAVT